MKESCRASPKFEDSVADLDARCLGEVMEDLGWLALGELDGRQDRRAP
jgi:hypothetical protein